MESQDKHNRGDYEKDPGREDLEKLTEDYLQHCRWVRKLSPATHRAYTFDMIQFNRFIGKQYPLVILAKDVSRSIIKEYLLQLNNRFAVSSAKRKAACLKGFFHYLVEEEIIENSPFEKIHFRVKEPYRLPDVMTLSEMRRVLDAVYQRPDREYCNSPVVDPEFIHIRDIAVMELLFATGMRVDELCSLQCQDFDHRDTSIKIIGKGNKERYVYIENKEVMEALDRYISLRNSLHPEHTFFFVNKFGEKLSSQAVRNMVTKYTQQAGINRHITPHTFRHTFASLLLEEGVDIKYIQEFLGHSSISTTQIYLHVSRRGARNVIKNMHPRERLNIGEKRNISHSE